MYPSNFHLAEEIWYSSNICMTYATHNSLLINQINQILSIKQCEVWLKILVHPL